VSSILLGYVYGPNAGKALYVPLEDFYRQGWYAVAPSQEGKVWEAGGIYKKPVYPYTLSDLDRNLDLIENWLRSGTGEAEAGNIVGAKHSLSMARDNIINARYRLNALRDSGLPNDLVESLSTLIRGMVDKSAPLQTKINESDAGAMASIGRAILSFFGSNVPSVQRVFSDYHRLARKKVIELYQLKKATEKFLREIVKLPQDGDMPKVASALSSELSVLNQTISRMESEATKHGMKLSELFNVPAGDLSDTGLGAPLLAPLFIAMGLSLKVAAVAAFVTLIVIDAIVAYVVWRYLGPGVSEEKLRESELTTQQAILDTFESEFKRLIALNPNMSPETIKNVQETAFGYAVAGKNLTNIEDLKKLADVKAIRIREGAFNAKGVKVGPLPGQPGYKADETTSPSPSESDETLILVIAGIVILGPILASLLRKN
jgi:hypothetical protein